MTIKPMSLARRLTVKMILLQIVTLTAFAVCISILNFVVNEGTLERPYPKIGREIAEAIQVMDGRLSLVPNAAFEHLRQAAPDMWFVVVDQSGRRFDYGTIPAEMAAVADSIAVLEAAEFSDSGATRINAVLGREYSPAGELRVLFGNGPIMGTLHSFGKYAIGKVLPLVVTLLVIGTVTGLVTPRFIGETLAGMRNAVRRAESIDIGKPGTRLPTTDVPTEIGALVHAVNAALERIDQGYERQQRFIADAAHELRTPIAILQNRVELFASGELTMNDGGLSASRLQLDVQRVANLAEQLLDLQRLDHDVDNFNTVDLVPLARQVVADLAPLAIDAGYAPQFVPEEPSVLVAGDSSSIERALINVFQNAVTYGQNRGAIVVRAASFGIEISDDGDGVVQEHREMVFEPFHRVKPTNRGAGLGLSLVREIMRRHHGQVVIGDSTSGGARFSLHFPSAGNTAAAA